MLQELEYSGALRWSQFLNPVQETLLGILAGAALRYVKGAALRENGTELFQDFHNLPEIRPLVRLQRAALLNQGSESRWAFWRNCWPQVLGKKQLCKKCIRFNSHCANKFSLDVVLKAGKKSLPYWRQHKPPGKGSGSRKEFFQTPFPTGATQSCRHQPFGCMPFA